MSAGALPDPGRAGRGLATELEALGALVRRSTVQVLASESGGGSGIVLRADGLILTNAHVARGKRAVVRLWDGERFEARVVRRDPRRDLAALAVDARGLPEATLGDSGVLKTGELVLAIGSPWGVPGVLAFGIVHASEVGDDARSPRYVRADVRLAPGNSGGPLADTAGRVVGINTMIAGGLAIAVATGEIAAFLRDMTASRATSRAA